MAREHDDVDSALTIRPANEASWDDLQTVFGRKGAASKCQCQRQVLGDGQWWYMTVEERAALLHEQINVDDPDAGDTCGLVAYLGDEPVGWCAVEPRTAYPRLLRNTRVPWDGRTEDKTDPTVWAVTCFVTRKGYRKRGVSRALARAAVHYARERGARALEGYPMDIESRNDRWLIGELHVGIRSVFVDAGFTEISHPTFRRVVMRIDY